MKLFDFAETLGDKSDIRKTLVVKLKGYLQKRGYHPGWILKVNHFTVSHACQRIVCMT